MEEGEQGEEFRPESEETKEVQSNKFIEGMKNNPWKVTSFVFILASVILLFLALKPGVTGNVIGGSDAGEKLAGYLNDRVGGGVEYVSYEDLGNIYQVNVQYQGNEIPVFITKDGEYFVQGISPLTGEAIQETESETQQPSTSQPQQKVDVSEDDDAIKGNANALVTIIEFSDYQCPFCGRHFANTLPLIISEYVDTGKVKLVFRDFPLSFHENAQKAAEAAECAGEEGDKKYWEYHDILFNNQEALSVDDLKQYAKNLGLNTGKFNECLDSGKYEEEVKKDFQDGQQVGVSGTPAFFINGRFVSGAQPFSVFKQIIDEELNR